MQFELLKTESKKKLKYSTGAVIKASNAASFKILKFS